MALKQLVQIKNVTCFQSQILFVVVFDNDLVMRFAAEINLWQLCLQSHELCMETL